MKIQRVSKGPVDKKIVVTTEKPETIILFPDKVELSDGTITECEKVVVTVCKVGRPLRFSLFGEKGPFYNHRSEVRVETIEV